MTEPAVLKCTWQAEVRQAHFLPEVSRCGNSRPVEETDGLALALDTTHSTPLADPDVNPGFPISWVKF